MNTARHCTIIDVAPVFCLAFLCCALRPCWAADPNLRSETPQLGMARIGFLPEMARRAAGKRNETPEQRFLYESALKLNNEMAHLTAEAEETSCLRLTSQFDSSVQLDQDRKSLLGYLKAIGRVELTEKRVATLCALSEGWKDYYVRELLVHSSSDFPIMSIAFIADPGGRGGWGGVFQFHGLLLSDVPFIPATFISPDEWLTLLRTSHVKDIDESDVVCLRSVVGDDKSYTLASFKQKSHSSADFRADEQQRLEATVDTLNFAFFRTKFKLPVVDNELVSFFASCGYHYSAAELERMFDSEAALRDTAHVAAQQWSELREYGSKYGTKTRANARCLCQLLRKDVRTVLFPYVVLYYIYSAEGHKLKVTSWGVPMSTVQYEGQKPGVTCFHDEIANLPDDSEAEYLSRVEKATRRLAACRRAAKANIEFLQSAINQFRRDDQISLERYQQARRYIEDSRELSRILDKLVRIYVIDSPIQLWVDLTKKRLDAAEGSIYNDHKAIMEAGTSLSRISPLIPYTVAAVTSGLLAEVRARIKKDLSEAEYEQTRLESKLLPDWFRQTGIDYVEEGDSGAGMPDGASR